MKVSIRMLGIATSVFWVLLIAFIILAAYSVTDLRFDIDEPELTVDSDGQLVFNLPLIIDNGGYKTKLIVGSIRDPNDVIDIASANPHIITIPYKILKQMPYHEKTVATLEEFDKAWEEFKKAEKTC